MSMFKRSTFGDGIGQAERKRLRFEFWAFMLMNVLEVLRKLGTSSPDIANNVAIVS